MNSRVKKYLHYISLAIVGVTLLFMLVQTVRAKNTGFETKSLWDWMELLIIPLLLAGGAIYLNREERESDRQRAEERAKLEREIATDRQQEAALQSYLDRMAELLLKEKLRNTNNKEVRDVARTRTLSVLRGLDKVRKGMVLLFLHEAGLINVKNAVIKLDGADLSYAYLHHANLNDVDLHNTNLENADLGNAFLNNTNLSRANLINAVLIDAKLNGANLIGANLRDAKLGHAALEHADLNGAELRCADLSNAILDNADLSEALLSKANLFGARISDEQLETIYSLMGTTMPDGTLYEEPDLLENEQEFEGDEQR